jgi:hypothetical protein
MMDTLDEALMSISGVPESQLSRDVAAGLPDSAPGPPWDCRVSSVFWFHRAKPGAVEALPEVLREAPRVAITIGALIRYIDSPVGAYTEIIAAPAFVRRPFPRAHVAFIAVDSEASVVGGRSNWALPKVLARFEGPSAWMETQAWWARTGGWASARGLGRCGCRPGHTTPAASCGQI